MCVPNRSVAALAFTLVLIASMFAPSACADTPSLRPGGTPTSGGMLVLAGSVHDHSTDSDGDASADAIAAWEFAHRAELGIDFGALSDHADFLPFSYHDPFGGNVWKRQAVIDRRFTRDGFSFLRGFEYTSDQENHVGVIGSSEFLGGSRANSVSMAPLYRWIAARDAAAAARGDTDDAGIVEFNHPSAKGALQWDNLTFEPSVAANVAAIEVYGDQGFSAKNLAHSDAGWYWLALARGWTVGPVMNWDTHHWHNILRQPDVGRSCGDGTRTLPCQRTLVLATANTPRAIMAALRARRTTATEHPSLWATLRGPGGIWQGSTLANAQAGSTIALTIEAGSSIWPLTSVQIVADGGIDPHAFYDGDNLTCGRRLHSLCARQANNDGQVAASYLIEHRRYLQSGGYALRKREIDGPPPDAIVATVALSGNHALTTVLVPIPRLPSVRPDGTHFFYAIVSAGAVRAWTAPIITAASP